jgi:hypothetical protein
MLEAILKIGRPDGWWNRKVPIARISLAVGVLLVGLYVWGAYGDSIGSIVWGVRHQRTATFRGQTLQLPWFWREEEWTNYNEFELTRSDRGLAFSSSVTVTYENSAPGDVQKSVERMKNNNAQALKVPGWFYDNYEGDDFSKTHYACLEQGFKWSPILSVDCFSRDGRWSVRMFGSKQTRREFEMILRGVASMGNPSK